MTSLLLAVHIHITAIEAVWSIVSLSGLLTTLWLLREAMRDRETMKSLGRNGPGLLLANGLVRTERLRVAQLAAMTALGIFALLSPNPDPTYAETFHALAGWALTGVAAIIAGNAVLDRKMRLEIDAELIKIYERGDDYRGVRPPERRHEERQEGPDRRVADFDERPHK